MVKKLQGETFLLSANELKSGKVVFFTSKGWSSSSGEAIKIKVDEINKYEEISIKEEKNVLLFLPNSLNWMTLEILKPLEIKLEVLE